MWHEVVYPAQVVTLLPDLDDIRWPSSVKRATRFCFGARPQARGGEKNHFSRSMPVWNGIIQV